MWDSLVAQFGSIDSLLLRVLVVLGGYQLLKLLLVLLHGILYFVRPAMNLRSYGSWAVVTGATDGIGFGYASELARRGLNVCLISRTESKLQECASEIKAKYPKVDVRTIVMDFSQPLNEKGYENISNELSHMEVGILVNNVGASYPHAEYLNLVDDKIISDLIELNVTSLTKMTKMVLPKMVERKKGCIVNVGSAAGTMVVGDPLYTVYSATKAYVDFFSRSLNIELRSSGIHVENQVPWFVVSKLSKIKRPSLTTPTAKVYARAACDRIGYGSRSVPYWSHALQDYLMNQVLPVWLVRRLVLGHHLGIRARAYKKKKET